MDDILGNINIIFNLLKSYGASQEGSILALFVVIGAFFVFKKKRKINSFDAFGILILTIAVYFGHIYFVGITLAYLKLMFTPLEAMNINYSIIFLFLAEGLVILVAFFEKKKKKEFIELIKAIPDILFWISILLLVNSFASIFSSYFMISPLLLLYSIGFLFGSTILVYLADISYNDIPFKNLKETIKQNSFLIICIIIIVFGVSLFSFPQVTKIHQSEDYYYLDGRQSSINNFNENRNFATLYEYETKEIAIKNPGIFGVLPISLENLIVNNSDYITPLYNSFGIKLIINETTTPSINLKEQSSELSKFNIRNYAYLNNSNIVLFEFDRIDFITLNASGFAFSNDSKIKEITITSSENRVENNSIIEINITNSLSKRLQIQGMYITIFRVDRLCSIINSTGTWSNSTSTINLSETSSCIGKQTCDIETNYYGLFRTLISNSYSNNSPNMYTLSNLMIPENSTSHLILTFDC